VIGYAGYFELLNGFKKTVYWPKERIIAHAKKYSKSFHKEDSPWQDPDKFEGMALKTVIRNMLSKWGILSIEMRDAFSQDLDTKLEYGEEPDVDDANVIDVTAEVTDAEEPQENIEPQQSHEFDGQEELKLA
jgi:recombination protein RecT